MRFTRSCIRFEPSITDRRIANAKRRLEREAQALPLLADLIRAEQPTPLEAVQTAEEKWRRTVESMRRGDAERWLRGRAILRSLPADRRAALIAEWNARKCPGSPEYFLDFLHTRLKGQAK